jgi:hypothetical protein
MTATELLCQLVGINPRQLSREQNILLEAELFTRVCDELREIYRVNNKDFFRTMKFTTEKEDAMLEANLIQCVINDILISEEYSLEGIACYTQIPEDVIYDIAAGCNITPSLPLSRKIIELHRTVRPNLYREILQKITDKVATA